MLFEALVVGSVDEFRYASLRILINFSVRMLAWLTHYARFILFGGYPSIFGRCPTVVGSRSSVIGVHPYFFGGVHHAGDVVECGSVYSFF